ncbi:MAG: TIGR02587 family membrane protein [Kastovskya adunca ATA6-11-RM4]|jgi:putative integral membrane protein (TIGR02587 family)|nr:TIGR02587 family membrane protein [Kastovskya adunca ATA6-11-RM4]
MAKIIRKRRYVSDATSQELRDIIRGTSGGFLFGIPLLYTMEVWWIGSQISPPVMLIILAVTFVVVFMLNSTEGFRQNKRVTFLDTVIDSVEALAIGIVSATMILILIREIDLSTPLYETLGKSVLESVPFSLGAALARASLSGDRWTNSDGKSPEKQQPITRKTTHKSHIQATLSDIGATLIGALIVGFNIAPTDEVSMLDAAVSPPWLLAFIAASLLISYCIVFEAGFTSEKKRRKQSGLFQRPVSETVISYLMSLIAAVSMLFFFQKLNFSDPWTMWLSSTIILGLPATIGGAAGRLAI